MATPKLWYATARATGGAKSLDSIDGDSLTDLDVGIVLANSIFWLYLLDDDASGTESDPGIINPDTNPGTKSWILQKCFGEKVNAAGAMGATETFDLDDGRCVTATVDEPVTLTFSNPLGTGYEDGFSLYLTNGGAFAVTWPGSVDWPGGSAPTLTAAGKDVLVFTTIDGGTIWNGFLVDSDVK
jgi:hypothetical protein